MLDRGLTVQSTGQTKSVVDPAQSTIERISGIWLFWERARVPQMPGMEYFWQRLVFANWGWGKGGSGIFDLPNAGISYSLQFWRADTKLFHLLSMTNNRHAVPAANGVSWSRMVIWLMFSYLPWLGWHKNQAFHPLLVGIHPGRLKTWRTCPWTVCRWKLEVPLPLFRIFVTFICSDPKVFSCSHVAWRIQGCSYPKRAWSMAGPEQQHETTDYPHCHCRPYYHLPVD